MMNNSKLYFLNTFKGYYLVTLQMCNLVGSTKTNYMIARAVMDDMGDLVMVRNFL